jgi:hypothetical protein
MARFSKLMYGETCALIHCHGEATNQKGDDKSPINMHISIVLGKGYTMHVLELL